MAYSSAAPSNASLKGFPAASNSCSLSSTHLAVRYNADSPTNTLIAISASLCLIAPKLEMGCLNCSLVLAYSTVPLNERLAPPIAAAHNFKRPMLRILKAILCPLPTSPNKFSTGTLQSWKYNCTVEEPLMPILCSSGPCVNPSVPLSTIKPVNLSPSTFAKTVYTCAKPPLVIQHFCPFSI